MWRARWWGMERQEQHPTHSDLRREVESPTASGTAAAAERQAFHSTAVVAAVAADADAAAVVVE